MSQPTKFRAWDGEKMVLFSLSEGIDCGYVFRNDESIALDNENVIVMQCTGLKDKNGVEIWAGDIVDARGQRGVVTWVDELAMFDLVVKLDDDGGEGSMTVYSKQEDGKNIYREVVGNIHQHPERLKA